MADFIDSELFRPGQCRATGRLDSFLLKVRGVCDWLECVWLEEKMDLVVRLDEISVADVRRVSAVRVGIVPRGETCQRVAFQREIVQQFVGRVNQAADGFWR